MKKFISLFVSALVCLSLNACDLSAQNVHDIVDIVMDEDEPEIQDDVVVEDEPVIEEENPVIEEDEVVEDEPVIEEEQPQYSNAHEFLQDLVNYYNYEDPDFDALNESLERQDAKESFEYAHGLKGMAANLGLEQIYSAICVLVEILRQGTVDGAREAYDKVKEACQVILELL